MSKSQVKPVPHGYHSVTPVPDRRWRRESPGLLRTGFRRHRTDADAGPGGKVGHAEISIGDSVIMLADEHPEMGARGPRTFGGSPVSLTLYVADVDATVKTAVAAGAKLLRPVEDKFYGDRSGSIEDPFGHHWHVSTHTEDVSPEEMARRATAMAKAG